MQIRLYLRLIAICLFLTLASPATFAKAGEHGREHESAAPSDAHVPTAAAELPLCFELNAGQTDEQVAFLARASGLGVFLTPDEIVLSLRRSTPVEHAEREKRPEPLAPAVLRMRLSSAKLSTPVGEQPLVTRTNYFVGDDPDRWRTDVPNFARVRYPGVYPGVDLVYYGRGGRLEYDFVVAPGADPSAIAVEWHGADAVALDGDGSLVLKIDGGELRQLPPSLYQQDGAGERRPVAGAFEPAGGGRFGLRVGAYDASRPLVVDPTLSYSTYLGGSFGVDAGWDIAVDADDSAYVTGSTDSVDFPTRNPYDATMSGLDAFVTKLSASGDHLIFSTYLGGGGEEIAYGIAVDAEGSAFVSGFTTSSNFPTARAYDTTFGGATDVFVTKLERSGGALAYSTYLGGSGGESSGDIALGPDGLAYVTGHTSSTKFPTSARAYDRSHNGAWDAFVTKLRPVADPAPLQPPLELAYSTFLGGSRQESPWDIAVDAAGAAYVSGWTASANFPTFQAYDSGFNGDWDVFVTRLTAEGDALDYSTFLGGAGTDNGGAVGLDGAGGVYISGYTQSSDFPTLNAIDATLDGPGDVFVAKLEFDAHAPPVQLAFSTYLGGSDFEQTTDLAVAPSGEVHIAGQTRSANFPTVDALDSSRDGLNDAFVLRLRSDGSALLFSTYLGGSDHDLATGIVVDAQGATYVVGSTTSIDLPTWTPYDASLSGPNDVFVAKLE